MSASSEYIDHMQKYIWSYLAEIDPDTQKSEPDQPSYMKLSELRLDGESGSKVILADERGNVDTMVKTIKAVSLLRLEAPEIVFFGERLVVSAYTVARPFRRKNFQSAVLHERTYLESDTFNPLGYLATLERSGPTIEQILAKHG